jgi:hypothetical protein
VRGCNSGCNYKNLILFLRILSSLSEETQNPQTLARVRENPRTVVALGFLLLVEVGGVEPPSKTSQYLVAQLFVI